MPLRARVEMKPDHGDVFSDFKIRLDASPVWSSRRGAPHMHASRLNGKIYIRKER